MQTKTFQPGDLISIKTKSKEWQGHALESHDSSIILLKLSSGYNIGIRESEILSAKVLKPQSQIKLNHPTTQPPSHQQLPNVAIVITGGTISSRLDPKTGGAIPTDAESILNIAPELKKICNPIIESPFMKLSENMDSKDWQKIAEICYKYLIDESISGIIVTHGSDTLHYTGAALHYFLQDLNKPIALTFSQRSIDRASTDAHLNLIAAARYATSDIAEVALIGHESTSDDTCIAIPAHKARKMHTSKRSTFKPINTSPLARITQDKIEILKTFNARNNQAPKLDNKYQNSVTSIKTHPGRDPSIIDFYLEKGYKGLIIETTGLGHVPAKDSEYNWLPKIKKAIEAGMIIVATAQTIYGDLNPNVYSAGRDLQKTGIIFSNLTTETALIKLGWVLGHKQWNKKEKFLQEY
ncbi:Glu-tRNA(Gln) amidotransferase subunit GatD [Candidatus Pacearchaeota archaeon]|nr:Glu-tRNA(Gln) amidotransferase subunit GatD [Candidatus Pacearchaeota archaeon]